MDEPTTPDAWSASAHDIYEALTAHREAGDEAVVATVVDVRGSAYRRPGARMVVTDESSLGAITAGCLEGPLSTLAAEVTEAAEPRVERFDLMDDDSWGFGMGCNGVIDILLEPLDESWDAALEALRERRPVAVLTAVERVDSDVAAGARTTLSVDGARTSRGRPPLPEEVVDELAPTAIEMAHSGRSGAVTVETDAGPLQIFVDGVDPAPELLLFGSQFDVRPVARHGRQVGFRVTVASPRGARSEPSDFPAAHRVRAVRPPELPGLVEAPERTYAVLMSHNLVDDRLALEALLSETPVPYVGLMGPRGRFEELREASDRSLSRADLDRIATPVGLDVGSQTPEQIALSVVGEALAVYHGRDGGRLRDGADPIHDRVDVE